MKKLRLIIAVLLCAAFLTLGASAQKYISEDTTDIVLLLDCTGYMESVGIEDEVKDALELFVELLPAKTRLSVIAFGNTWNLSYDFESEKLSDMNDIMGSYARTRVCLAAELIELDDPSVRSELSETINFRIDEGRYTHTNTYIGGGLMAALDRLFEQSSDERYVFLLTNGRLSGFDSTDGVEWKQTNRELCDFAASLAAENGIEIYSLELNTDGKNSNASAARELLNGLSASTGGVSVEISDDSFDSLSDGILEIFSNMFDSEQSSSTELKLSETVSEISIITNGSDLTVNGKSFKSELKSIGDQSILRLTAPFDSDKLMLSGQGLKTVITERLSLTVELDREAVMTRNQPIAINAYLSSGGEPISAPKFYESNRLELKLNGETIAFETAENGWSAVCTPKRAGSYVITAEADSEKIGADFVSIPMTVEEYGFETVIVGHDAELSRGESVTVAAFLTGTEGRLTDPELYKDGEALLSVKRNGETIVSELAMNGKEGYFAEFTADDMGNYEFSVTARPSCLENEPSVIYSSMNAECGDFTLEADWTANRLEPVSTLQKSVIVRVEASLIGADGNVITRGKYLEDGAAKLIVSIDGERFAELPASVSDGRIIAEWRIVRSGAAELSLVIGDSGKTSELSFKSVNHEPSLVKDELELTLSVGEERRIKLSELVADEDGDLFMITSEGDSLDWTADEDELVINAGTHSGDKRLSFIFNDGDTSVELSARIKITNKRPEKTAELELPHFILNTPGFMFFVDHADEALRFDLGEYFADPEGLPLTYTLETDGSASLSGSILEVIPSEPQSAKLILTVTDSSDESIRVELKLTVDDWWTLNARRVITAAIIAAVVLILIAIIIRRESNIGYLKLVSAQKGEDALEINEKINRRRIRLWSLELSKLYKNRIRLDESELPSESGRVTGHLIFGSKVTLVSCSADGYERNGELVKKKLPKKLVLRSGESITLVYGELKITLTNRN